MGYLAGEPIIRKKGNKRSRLADGHRSRDLWKMLMTTESFRSSAGVQTSPWATCNIWRFCRLRINCSQLKYPRETKPSSSQRHNLNSPNVKRGISATESSTMGQQRIVWVQMVKDQMVSIKWSISNGQYQMVNIKWLILNLQYKIIKI